MEAQATQEPTFDLMWEKLHADRRWGQFPNEHLVRFVRRWEWPDKPRALDLGCGAGAQSLFLNDEGFDVVAVDASVAAISRLIENIEHTNIKPFCSCITNIPVDIGQFDLIVDVCTLQHLPRHNARDVLRTARSWLKPGGYLFSVMASYEHLAGGMIKPRCATTVDINHLFHGYKWLAGSEVQRRPDGNRIGHWIIEAHI